MAQGSGSTAPPPSGGGGASLDIPFQVTRILDGKVASVDAERRILIVEDKKGKKSEFRLNSRSRIKADKKTEFGAKKNVEIADFQVGDPVRVVYDPDASTVIELRLLYVKKAA